MFIDGRDMQLNFVYCSYMKPQYRYHFLINHVNFRYTEREESSDFLPGFIILINNKYFIFSLCI